MTNQNWCQKLGLVALLVLIGGSSLINCAPMAGPRNPDMLVSCMYDQNGDCTLYEYFLLKSDVICYGNYDKIFCMPRNQTRLGQGIER